MANKSLQHSSLTDNIFYRSMLAGNAAYFPEFESDDFLEEVVLTSSAASVTFSGLDSYATAGYKHLQIRAVVRTTWAGSLLGSMQVQFNSDTSVSYSTHRLRGNGSTVASSSYLGNRIQFNDLVPQATSGSGVFSALVVDILDFSSTTKNTTIKALFGGLASGAKTVHFDSGAYFNTDAISSINLLDGDANFEVGSRFSLYGSKG